MALLFPTPSEIGDQYLTVLKSLKPDVDVSRQDSDWWIRSRAVGGVVSGAYADQRKIADDAFPQNARREALAKHLFVYFDRGFNPAQQSDGLAAVTGVDGTTVTALTEFVYTPNGNVYQSTEDVTLSGTTGLIPVQSVSSGQSQNLLDGAPLTISSPPAGLNSSAVAAGNIGDGRDIESSDEAAAAILDFIRQPPAGGNKTDYARFAKEADPSVVDANVIRYLFGLGTLGIAITAGTTDIDTAVDNNQPVVRTPSDALVAAVQDYIDTKKVETDCVTVFGPVEKTVDVTVNVRFASGDSSTEIAGIGLTQAELVQREVKRALYKVPPGGTQFGGSGFVVLSNIEESVDLSISALPYTVGRLGEFLVDRQFDNLSATGPNLMISPLEIPVPGTITIVEM